MRKAIAFVSALAISFWPLAAFAIPSIGDTLNITTHHIAPAGTSYSASYTIPSGSNQVLVYFMSGDVAGASGVSAVTQNGASTTAVDNRVSGKCDGTFASKEQYGYLVAPTTGNFVITKGSGGGLDFAYFTVNNAAQVNPIDIANCNGNNNAGTISTSLTPSTANTLLLDWGTSGNNSFGSHGNGQTEWAKFDDSACCLAMAASYVNGSSSASQLQAMSENYSGAVNWDLQVLAIKAVVAAASIVNNDVVNFFNMMHN